MKEYKVPFVDLRKQIKDLKSEFDSAYERVMQSGIFLWGSEVLAFEKAFAAHHGVPYCISCANGTDALELALRALGIGKGDEVIVPANTWISASETVSYTGATPVFADIDENTFNLSAEDVERRISDRTRAIIFVHLFGNPAGFEKIHRIAAEHGLILIEDCAQGHEASVKGNLAGTLGHLGCFSFYPSKNLGALGDAGAMITRDAGLAEKFKQIANHGQLRKNVHVSEGRNSRMDELQAAFLNVKLKYLKKWTWQRQQAAQVYFQLLQNSDIILPETEEGSSHTFHLFVVRVKQREKVQQYLDQKGIQTAIHYPLPLPFTEAYKSRGYNKTDFPVACQLSGEILSLPMFPEITSEQIHYTCKSLLKAVKSS